MNLAAGVGYLRTLREVKGYTQHTLAQAIGVHKRTIERLEQLEPDAENMAWATMLQIVRTVGGSLDHLEQLLVDPKATADDGRRLAERWLSRGELQGERASIQETAMAYGADRVAQIAEELAGLPPEAQAEVITRALRHR